MFFWRHWKNSQPLAVRGMNKRRRFCFLAPLVASTYLFLCNTPHILLGFHPWNHNLMSAADTF